MSETVQCKCSKPNGFKLFLDWSVGMLVVLFILNYLVNYEAHKSLNKMGYWVRDAIVINGTLYTSDETYFITPVTKTVAFWTYFTYSKYNFAQDATDKYYITMKTLNKKWIGITFHVRKGEMVVWDGDVWKIVPYQRLVNPDKVMNKTLSFDDVIAK